jgi:tripartite-type tricarboxylate transporter receptor subunit TctC
MTNKADATRRGHREAAMRDARNWPVARSTYWLLGAFAVVLLSGPAQAQSDYPNRAVRIVVPATPGGGSDTFARLVAQHLAAVFGQQFVVDNRPGGGTLVGMDAVLNAPHDGHTLYLSPSTTTSMHVARKTMPYDVRRVFTPVTQLVVVPQALIVNPSVPAKTTAEFIALAKREPGKLTYGSAGIGTAPHMAMELFKSMTGIDVRHVPYRGIPEALTDVVAGRIHFTFSPLSSVLPLAATGEIVALAVAPATRAAAMPNVPTVAEAGVPGYFWDTWFGFLAPAKTPPAIVTALNRAMVRIIQLPEVKKRWDTLGAEPLPMSPEQFEKYLAEQSQLVAKLVKTANIEVK